MKREVRCTAVVAETAVAETAKGSAAAETAVAETAKGSAAAATDVPSPLPVKDKKMG